MTERTRVAIVGAGPSGFYTAAELIARLKDSVEIDFFDRLPTPFGLVRSGVAPDHPKIKSVTRIFDRVVANNAQIVRFFGGVQIGVHVRHEELAEHYHAVVYAVGATRDRKLGIPGEHLSGCHGAADFVGWYNGHPDMRQLPVDLGVERAVVVGNGNVALDIARMLTTPIEILAQTDIADHALTTLANSTIREVVVVGRRGPAEAAWTNPELSELGEIPGVEVEIPTVGIPAGWDRPEYVAGLSQTRQLNVALTRQYLAGQEDRHGSAEQRRIRLQFLSTPTAIIGEERVGGMRVAHNSLRYNTTGVAVAEPGDSGEIIEAGLIISAVGFETSAVRGVPVDARRGTILNESGRVLADSLAADLSGVYVSGWAKRGPSGVIGTNKPCAHDTVDSLITDLQAGRLRRSTRDRSSLEELVRRRCPNHVTWTGWNAIDAAERDNGARLGRPRVKYTDPAAMIAIAHCEAVAE
ncbi:FAD-dependent oxidoreductase [Nocardia nepalensis]|uniref:FAD-dependent oxidoreductase n=1 Tax=Nocardia nepalensis TaxID=3375448 RepID=UPI003B6829B7